MKLVRFIKKIAKQIGEVIGFLMIMSLSMGILSGIIWVIGWIALMLGFPTPSNPDVIHVELACGWSIIILLAGIGLIVSMIIKFYKHLKEIWEEC